MTEVNNMSSILFDKHPLVVNPTLATIIGLEEAIVLQQIHYWIEIKREDGDKRYFHDNKWWVYNTYDEWLKQFPFMSKRKLQRVFKNLDKEYKLIISGCYNKYGYDRTKWYTINYNTLETLENKESAKLATWKVPNRNVGKCQNDVTNTIDYTEIISENTNNIEPFFENGYISFEGWQSLDDYIKYYDDVLPKQIHSVYVSDYELSEEELISVVKYFYDKYEECTGDYHPPYSKAMLKKIFDTWCETLEYCDYDYIKAMMDLFFSHDNIVGKHLTVFSTPKMLPFLDAEIDGNYSKLYY